MTAPKIINPNDKDCPKIEYNNYNNKIINCNTQNNNELKGNNNGQHYKIIHSVSDSPNSSSEDCILIEDDDDDEKEENETMLVSDSGQNKNNNGYVIKNDQKTTYTTTHLENTIELPSNNESTTTTILTNNKIYNNNLIKFQIPQTNYQPQLPPLVLLPSSSSSLTSTSKNNINIISNELQKNKNLIENNSYREIATSTTSLNKNSILTNKYIESTKSSSNNDLSIKYCGESNVSAVVGTTAKANATKLANELIKRLQSSSETTKSNILNNKNNRLKNLNCIAPTKIHRIPNPRDVASVDSLNLEMCHFKPIKTVPTTPIKTPNAVIIKIPVAKKLKIKNRKCDVFIGPKKGLMPVLFSTTTSERFSAFYLYNNIKNSLPLVVPTKQKQIKKNNKLKKNTQIKPKSNVKIKQQQKKPSKKQKSLKLQKITKKKFFAKICKIKLKRCKFPPKYLKEQLINTKIPELKRNLRSREKSFSTINSNNINTNNNITINNINLRKHNKSVESIPNKKVQNTSINSNINNNKNPLKMTLRRYVQPINYCETLQHTTKVKSIYSKLPTQKPPQQSPPNKLIDNREPLRNRSKTVVGNPYVSKEITIINTNTITTTTNNTNTVSKKLLSTNNNNKLIDNNKKINTANSLRIKKNQERLDFEYAKRLQDEYLNECGPIQPIALRLRRRSMSSMGGVGVINFDQQQNHQNIENNNYSTNNTYNKNNHKTNRKAGPNLIISKKTLTASLK